MATPNPEPEFVRELAEKYKCSICTNLLNTPVLTECCGQHFCRYCLKKWITRKKATICPHCRTKNFNKIVSQPTIRKIKELQVYCTNRKNGCKEILSYGAFPEHVNICPFEVVTCTNNCDIAGLLRKDLKQHCQEECSNRIVNCSLCNEEGKHSLIVGDHTKWCPDVILECPNKCGEKVKRKDIEQHREQQCPLEVVECAFKEAGCEVSLPRKDLPDHEMTAMQNHLRLTMLNMVTKESHEELRESHKELKLKLDTISSVVSKELSSLDTGNMAPQSIASIQTTLTSLTTMIQPDGKVHTVHISKELGVCRESEQNELSPIMTASSPLLWVHPGFRIYLCVYRSSMLCIVMLKSPTHGYPDNLSMQVQVRTEPSHTFELNKCYKRLNEIRMLANGEILSDVQDSDNFYVNVIFKPSYS